MKDVRILLVGDRKWTFNCCCFGLLWPSQMSNNKSYSIGLHEYNLKFFQMAAQVGKTSLILSLVSEEFPEEVRELSRLSISWSLSLYYELSLIFKLQMFWIKCTSTVFSSSYCIWLWQSLPMQYLCILVFLLLTPGPVIDPFALWRVLGLLFFMSTSEQVCIPWHKRKAISKPRDCRGLRLGQTKQHLQKNCFTGWVVQLINYLLF